ncbi:winged helix-turn-helix domain-containing protein [soil metagenome]
MYDDIGVVQIDPINVLARAHHQVVMSRLGPYDRDALDRWLWRSGEVHEGWIHVDATAQVATWPLFAHRRAATTTWRMFHDGQQFLDQVLAEVTERGELSAAQLHDQGERIEGWGTGSAGRAALDFHHMRGTLALSWRDDRMTAHFDLADRVIPARWFQAEVPPPEEAERALLLRAVKAMGLGTAADVADHHRQHTPRSRRHLASLAATGAITEIEVQGWRGPVYADPDLVIPRQVDACALVNPFDPLVWFRDRTLRLFGMDYRIEIYVPAAKRRFGYYALPFLLGEHLVARVDLKLDRSAGRLLVQQATAEPDIDPAAVAGPLAGELQDWATWLGAADIAVPGDRPLAVAVARALS